MTYHLEFGGKEADVNLAEILLGDSETKQHIVTTVLLALREATNGTGLEIVQKHALDILRDITSKSGADGVVAELRTGVPIAEIEQHVKASNPHLHKVTETLVYQVRRA